MTPMRRLASAALCLAILAPAAPAAADVVTADCTGMLNHDIYRIDPDLPQQEIEGLGPAEVEIVDGQIRVTGSFGEYRFDLRVGTLYHDGRDTGLYCTYRGIERR